MSPMPGTENQEISRMEVEVGEAHFLTMLTRDIGRQHDRPMKALDIGTFTGHSAGAMARGMENGGTVITIDVNDKYKSIAEQYWKKEGIADRIDYRIEPVGAESQGGARKVLEELVNNWEELGTYDIVFIDADKTGYKHYYEEALKLLRPGGKVIFDNMLWSGRVTDPNANDPNTDALRDLNMEISRDPRVDAVLLNADDGIMIAEKCGFTRQIVKSTEGKVPG